MITKIEEKGETYVTLDENSKSNYLTAELLSRMIRRSKVPIYEKMCERIYENPTKYHGLVENAEVIRKELVRIGPVTEEEKTVGEELIRKLGGLHKADLIESNCNSISTTYQSALRLYNVNKRAASENVETADKLAEVFGISKLSKLLNPLIGDIGK